MGTFPLLLLRLNLFQRHFIRLGDGKAIALAWLFHLVGDIHQPLHTVQLFTVDYPQGDRGGNEICVRVTQTGQPIDLHRFWDSVMTSSSNLKKSSGRLEKRSKSIAWLEQAENNQCSFTDAPLQEDGTLWESPTRAACIAKRCPGVLWELG